MEPPREIIYLDGRFLGPDELATVDLRDRGYLFGDTVFETVRAFGGVAFALDRHMARLTEAASLVGIAMPDADIEEITASALASLAQPDATLRYTLSRGVGPWGLSMSGPFSPCFSVVARRTTAHAEARYAEGIDAKIVETRRVPAACMPTRVKTGNYLSTVLARRELEADGLVEGIQLTVDGRVSSGTLSSVFAVIDGTLCTPSLDCDCRAGVTREIVLELAPRSGLVVAERHLTPADLANASEVFFVSSLADCLPARSIRGVGAYDSREVARRLRELLRAARSSPTAR
jgi:branched-chain amino acid aminotransferase